MGKKISIKAICVGVLIGLIGSSLASVIVAVLWGVPFKADMFSKVFYSSIPCLISDLVLSFALYFPEWLRDGQGW